MSRLSVVATGVAMAFTSSCSDVVVDVIGASAVHRQSIPEFSSTDPHDVIELLIAQPDFEKHIGERGSLGLYASDCQSDQPGVHLGGRVGPGRFDVKRRGYWLRFVLEPLQANAHYAENWSERLQCVYMKTEPDYNPTTYRSNFVRVGSAV